MSRNWRHALAIRYGNERLFGSFFGHNSSQGEWGMAPNDRETIIVDRDGGRGAGGIIIGVIVALALIGIAYLVFFNNNGGGGGTVDVDVPAVSVDVVPDGQ
jgi:hypothetical protein